MSPLVALLAWLILLLALLYFDPAKEPKTSVALWVPIAWMFIAATRLVSQWLNGIIVSGSATIEEGNPLDRAFYFVLMFLAIGILFSRSFKWGAFFTRNAALMAYLSFALLSLLWSDFPFVAFKRWFRDLGNYLMILVVLSDPHPFEPVRTLLRRLCYLLIPLSVLLVKYFPEIGRQYSIWSGQAMYVGPTTGKDLLGVVCLISGIFFFWDTLSRWSDHRKWRTKQILLVNVLFGAMTLWLLHLSHCATCGACLFLGCLVIAAAHTRMFQRRPALLKVLVPASFLVYLVLAYGMGMNASIAASLGRDPTLTDRTYIWAALLDVHTNPFLGTGYESFWLGERLQTFWTNFHGINEAHNGYLEVYLNLGLIGLLLLVGFLIAGYRNICKRLKPFSSLGSLGLAFWIVFLFQNMSEASFRSGLMWFSVLLVAIVVPERPRSQPTSVITTDAMEPVEQFPIVG